MYKRRCRQLRTRWSFFTDRIVPRMALDFCWRPPWTVRAFSVSIIAIQHTKHGYNGIFICVWCPPTSFGCAPDLWVPGWCCWYSFLLDARFSIPKLALQWFNYPVFSPPVRSVITQKFSFHSLLLVHNILFCCRRHIRFFFCSDIAQFSELLYRLPVGQRCLTIRYLSILNSSTANKNHSFHSIYPIDENDFRLI